MNNDELKTLQETWGISVNTSQGYSSEGIHVGIHLAQNVLFCLFYSFKLMYYFILFFFLLLTVWCQNLLSKTNVQITLKLLRDMNKDLEYQIRYQSFQWRIQDLWKGRAGNPNSAPGLIFFFGCHLHYEVGVLTLPHPVRTGWKAKKKIGRKRPPPPFSGQFGQFGPPPWIHHCILWEICE